jgi:leucyl aminopeptidase (aminopeptidase T)
MPGFSDAMVPALRLDWMEIHSRCRALKEELDAAEGAEIATTALEEDHLLYLDLRHRSAHASGGMIAEPGVAGNLPSGETYIVPYEGEIEGDPSRSEGMLPLQLGGEIFAFRIAGNRVVAVLGDGPVARAEWAEMEREPGYRNVAELGLGILADYGIAPVGELLLDEKLGLHVAFGRSDHFGGVTGPSQFSAPEKVVHIDRVYIPEVQPAVRVRAVDLHMKGGAVVPLMRDGRWTSRP